MVVFVGLLHMEEEHAVSAAVVRLCSSMSWGDACSNIAYVGSFCENSLNMAAIEL